MALPWVMLSSPNMGAFVALVTLVCTAVSFVLTPFFSTLVDRHSRKKILVWVLAIQAITAFGIMLSYALGFASNWVLASAQLIFWVVSNLGWSANNAFTQENYDRHEYAALSGKQEVVVQGTTLLAGAVGVVLLESWAMQSFAMFAAVTSLLGMACYLLTPYRQKLRRPDALSFRRQLFESKTIYRNDPVFYSILLLSSLSYPVLTYLSKLVPIWFAEQGVSGRWFASYYLFFGVGSLVTGIFITRLLALSSLKNIMLAALALSALMLVGMSVFISPLFLLIFVAGFGFSNALNRIARINWMHIRIDVNQRGRADGLVALFSTLVQNLSYLLIAFLASRHIVQFGFVIAALVIVLATVTMYLLIGVNRRTEETSINKKVQMY
ncbi:putative MFS family arabinose efflux permease [Reinekea marinisedimentorum]|uniref:Putative MFS family arabinose efflux permease n=2 Tax=Reinekea marinisedimentorum TaxID=230495 RepID=A0A4R3I2G5_9GAMM|nr:putative MFS family arabinose efflux permease [Reinekea marinisedimentorum]